MSYPYVDSRHIKECDCEDYPCCGHTDNIPLTAEDCYCSDCGFSHLGGCALDFDSDELYCARCGEAHETEDHEVSLSHEEAFQSAVIDLVIQLMSRQTYLTQDQVRKLAKDAVDGYFEEEEVI